MTIQAILRMGEALLLQQATPVEYFNTTELDALISDLWDTMRANNGAGLAAPQIGVLQQVVVFGMQDNPRYPHANLVPEQVLINPTITPIGDTLVEGWEGCLSIPEMRGSVPRYESIHYTAFNAQGDSFSYEATGFHARVVQHECDHLWGKLYPMRMKDMSQFGFVDAIDTALK
jgi:peptide deformylase